MPLLGSTSQSTDLIESLVLSRSAVEVLGIGLCGCLQLGLAFSTVFGGDCDALSVIELVSDALDGIDITATLTAYQPSICFLLVLSDSNELALDFLTYF